MIENYEFPLPIPISFILNRNPNDILLFEGKIGEFMKEKNLSIFITLNTSFAIFNRFIDAYELKKTNNEENLLLAKATNFAVQFTILGNKLILLWFTKIDSKTFVNIFCYCEENNIQNIGNLKKYLLNIFPSQ